MSTSKSPNGNSIDFVSGGREAIERLVEAYGFSTRQALADHLNVSKSTLANRYLRDTFPGDWIIRCSLETGASLAWLASGAGSKFPNNQSDLITLNNFKIIEGDLHKSNYLIFDKSMLSNNSDNLLTIMINNKVYIADRSFQEVSDGQWVVKIEGKTSIRSLTRIPVGRVRVENESSNFECLLEEIDIIAKCQSVFIKNI